MLKIILFDLDYTLIDTDLLRKLTHLKISQTINSPRAEIERVTEIFSLSLKKSIRFSPKKYARFLASGLNQAELENRILKVFSLRNLYRKSVYPQTLPILKKLAGHYRLGIFSEGAKEFQIAKLKLSGIINYLDRELIFIYSDKTGKAGKLVQKFGEIFFVDDNPRHIKDIAVTPGAHPIWLRTGPKAQAERKLNCPTISFLSEIENYLA